MSNPQPITTPLQAQEVVGHLTDVMEALLKIVEEETALVRAGRISEVGRLEPVKTDLARLYLSDIGRVKASTPYLKQQHEAMLEALRRGHDNFSALLQINLTVLATAHAVSEGIMRGVSEEINRKAAPQVYGATGREAASGIGRNRPIALSRSL